MKKPLVVFALIFCLGIWVAPQVRITFLLVYGLGLIFLFLGVISFRKEFRLNVFLCCLIFCLGSGLYKNYQILPRCHISGYASYKNNLQSTIKGVIVSQPLFKNNVVSFTFKAEEIWLGNLAYNTCGNILVYVRCKNSLIDSMAQLKGLHYAEELILSGNLHRPFGFPGSGRKSYRDYLYNQGVFSVMNVGMAGSVVKLKKNKRLVLRRLPLRLKDMAEATIYNRISFASAGIMDAMILGEKRNIPVLINNSMMKSGTVHILVVSGFNVALVAFIVILFLRLIRVPRSVRSYIAIPLIIIYCFMAGASTPVIRATIMAVVFIYAYLIKREPDIYNSCALAAVSILAFNPCQLFDVGFQLSFASVISITCLYPRLKALALPFTSKIKYISFIVDGFLVSFSAWLGTMGLIAYYFRIISPVTVLANIFIVPLASLVTLCGFSLILMELVCPFLSPLFASSSEIIVAALLNINNLLIKLPGAYFYLP